MLQKIKLDGDEDDVRTFVEQLLKNGYWVRVTPVQTLEQKVRGSWAHSYEIEFEKEGEE